MTDLPTLTGLIRSSSDHVVSELMALGEEGASFHPAEGEWCAKEVVGHIIEADRRGFWGRVRDIVAGAPIVSWDQSGVAVARQDCGKSVADLVSEFDTTRDEGLSVLANLAEADFEASGVHPDVGVVSVGDILHEWVFHDRDHIKQILDNTRALVWPDMGGTQRFSEID